jgi:sugar phosphate isomerase/epimerase/predicted metal-dependent hydrolase
VPVDLRLGISSGSLFPWAVTESAPSIAAGWGATDIELLLQTSGEHEPAFLRGAAREAAQCGVRVNSIHPYQELFPMFSAYQRRTDEALLAFERVIETAGELGIGKIVWHGLDRPFAHTPERKAQLMKHAERLARRCAESGVTLAMENASGSTLATVRELFAFAARIPELGSPGSIGFTFDCFQAAEAGVNPFMALAAMEGLIANVHVSDARENDPSVRHLPPGDGDLPWPALIRAIANSGYEGPMLIEGPLDQEGDAWRRASATISPLIAQLALDGPDAPLPAGVIEGIELFNAGEYYEAHEVIEHEWHAERGPVRRLYQGILQIGVGLHHTRAGNYRGAVLLLTDGIQKTAEFAPDYRGVDTARLVREAQACLDQVIALGPDRLSAFDWSMVPVIALPAGKADR